VRKRICPFGDLADGVRFKFFTETGFVDKGLLASFLGKRPLQIQKLFNP